MRYKDKSFIIPYLNYEGERTMARFRFYGDVDRRRVRREIRKYFTDLGIWMPNQIMNLYLKCRAYDIY